LAVSVQVTFAFSMPSGSYRPDGRGSYSKFDENPSLHIRGRPGLILDVYFCIKICAATCPQCKEPLPRNILFDAKKTPPVSRHLLY
jgi:hypothetical protein